MRTVSIPIQIEKVVSVTEMATQDDLTIVNKNKNDKTIYVVRELRDNNGKVIRSSEHNIKDDYYELLMSESPDFAPGKPLNDCREEDIFYILDLMMSEDN